MEMQLPGNPQDVTNLLDKVRCGDTRAFGQLIGQIYDELRVMARGQRRRLGASNTVNTTAVVHEAYAKMAKSARRNEGLDFQNRGHFFRVASRVMRDVIVDYAKAQSAEKRGGRTKDLHIDDVTGLSKVVNLDPHEVLSINHSLEELESLDLKAAQVAELKYFAGLTNDETAEALSISVATVKRRWTVARAWMYKRLKESE